MNAYQAGVAAAQKAIGGVNNALFNNTPQPTPQRGYQPGYQQQPTWNQTVTNATQYDTPQSQAAAQQGLAQAGNNIMNAPGGAPIINFLRNLGKGGQMMGRIAGQAGQGIANSVVAGGQGMLEGGQMIGSAFDPNQDLTGIERGSRVVGGLVKGGSEAAWLAPNALISAASNIDETKPIGQAMGWLPTFMKETAQKMYGKGGDYQQAIEKILPEGTLKQILRGTAQFGQEVAVPTSEFAGRLATMYGMGKVKEGAVAARDTVMNQFGQSVDVPPPVDLGLPTYGKQKNYKWNKDTRAMEPMAAQDMETMPVGKSAGGDYEIRSRMEFTDTDGIRMGVITRGDIVMDKSGQQYKVLEPRGSDLKVLPINNTGSINPTPWNSNTDINGNPIEPDTQTETKHKVKSSDAADNSVPGKRSITQAFNKSKKK